MISAKTAANASEWFDAISNDRNTVYFYALVSPGISRAIACPCGCIYSYNSLLLKTSDSLTSSSASVMGPAPLIMF
jgi:hypothetical protein